MRKRSQFSFAHRAFRHKNDPGRRTTLRWIAGVFGAALLGGCTGSSSASDGHTGAGPDAKPHPATPEGEIGPYFADDSASRFHRGNILANLDGTDVQPGIPLTLTLCVYDTGNNNAAMEGVQIDIWHCNASGSYSDEPNLGTEEQTWLRGYQVTDARGRVTFKTIMPGWYEGRTTHIHLRLRSKYSETSSTDDGTNTTQLFFPQATTDYISTHISPYNLHGVDTTTNDDDHVFTPETQGQTELALAGDYTSGFSSTFSIYLPITSV